MLGKKLLETKSSFNGKIKVTQFLGKTRIFADGLLQSGGLIKNIWKKAFDQKTVVRFKKKPKLKVLVLGLGGGTAVCLINQRYPDSAITAIEIDPLMISLGRKYFNLNNIKNLKIIKQDAVQWIDDCQQKFDLIIVDLYCGDQFPVEAETEKFLKKISSLVLQKGLVIFNRLFYRHHRKQAEQFINKADKIFSKIFLVRAWSNLLVFCEAEAKICKKGNNVGKYKKL